MPSLQIEHFYILLGAGLVASGLYTYALRSQTEHWTQVQGTVTHSEVKTVFVGNFSEQLEVSYAFTVSGKSYHGSTSGSGSLFSRSSPVPGISSARSALKHYSKGAKVTVYYDPLKPERNALSPGNKRLSYWSIAIGVVVMAVAIIKLS